MKQHVVDSHDPIIYSLTHSLRSIHIVIQYVYKYIIYIKLFRNGRGCCRSNTLFNRTSCGKNEDCLTQYLENFPDLFRHTGKVCSVYGHKELKPQATGQVLVKVKLDTAGV